jgi:membrane-associated phospholipid phosphatase
MSDIFISYYHEDRPRAEALARAFEAAGMSVWWDRSIPAGTNFDQVIERALGESKVVVALWSQSSVASRWVLNEAEEAAIRHILVPVLIEGGVKIPLAFKRIQAANLVDWDGASDAPACADLVAAIAGRLRGTAATLPVESQPPQLPAPESHAEPPPIDSGRRGLRPWPVTNGFRRRINLTGLLAGVFALNYVETMAEGALSRRYGMTNQLGSQLAAAFSALEGHLSFESHDLTNWTAVYGYSAAYFFALPAIAIGLAAALWRRTQVDGYRLLCVAIAADYLLSLGFFLFFPVPERWAYPESGAMLLSDRWSSTLIEVLRPISALDNCFPSTHVSFTVVVVLIGYLCRVRLRHTMTALGLLVVLSTFVLGIHWLPDIVAGIAVGTFSVGIARRMATIAPAGAV